MANIIFFRDYSSLNIFIVVETLLTKFSKRITNYKNYTYIKNKSLQKGKQFYIEEFTIFGVVRANASVVFNVILLVTYIFSTINK